MSSQQERMTMTPEPGQPVLLRGGRYGGEHGLFVSHDRGTDKWWIFVRYWSAMPIVLRRRDQFEVMPFANVEPFLQRIDDAKADALREAAEAYERSATPIPGSLIPGWLRDLADAQKGAARA